MVEFDYSVREVKRDPKMLEKELLDLGDYGWEVVVILERSVHGRTATQNTWVIVSKKLLDRE